MKSISKLLVMLLLIGALGAGLVLVRRNQETRRGATVAESSTSILPSEVSVQPGDTFKVNLLVNTGKDTDKLTGVEMTVSYDSTKIKYDSITVDAASGYSLLNDMATVDNGAGKLTLNMVAMGAEKGGAISLAKLNFKALGEGTGIIKVSAAKVLVSGQTSTWDVSKHDVSVIKVGGPLTTLMPVDPTVTPKVTAILPVVTTTITPRPTIILPVITPSNKCNSRCQKDADCGGGMICKPIWWSCEKPVPTEVVSLIQNKEPLSSDSVNKIISVCPDVEKLLTSSSTISGLKLAPSSMGMCRNPKCINDFDCNCGSDFPIVTPTTVPTVTKVPSISAVISGKFEADSYLVGSLVPAEVAITSGAGKVSGADLAIVFDAKTLNLDSVQLDSSLYSLVNKQIDNTKGKLVVGIVASRPANELIGTVRLKLSFKAKAVGKVSLKLDETYISSVVGINNLGNSVRFEVVSGVWGVANMVNPEVPTVCKKCSGEPSKAKGNSNCDGSVNMLDFEIWRNEAYDQGGLEDAQKGVVSNKWNADFDCNGKVMLVEFEIWRRTVYQ